MGEFVRRNNKVRWGNYNENNNSNENINDNDEDTEEEEDTNNWHLNVKNSNNDDNHSNGNESDRGSLSSPESHRSQDSGFSDSETNSPTTSRVPINTSLNKSPKNKINNTNNSSNNNKIDQDLLLDKCEIINADETEEEEEVLINNKIMDKKPIKKVTTSYPLKDIKNTILQNNSSTTKQRNFLTTKNKNYDELYNDNDFEDDVTFFEEKNENKKKFNHVVNELKITLQENLNYKKNKSLSNTVNNKNNKFPIRNTSLPYFNDNDDIVLHESDDDNDTKEELSSINKKDYLSLPINCSNNNTDDEINIENNCSLKNSKTDLTNCDNNLNTNGTKPKFKLNTNNSNKKINDLNRSLERTRLRFSQINESTIHRLFLRNDPNRSLEQTRILRSQRENDYDLLKYNKKRKNIKDNNDNKEIDYYEIDEDEDKDDNEEEIGDKEDGSSFDSSFCRTEETAKFVGDIISNNSIDNHNKNNFNFNDYNSSTWSIPGPPEYCSTPKSCSSNNTKNLPTGEDLTKNKLTPQKLNFNEPNENSYYENGNQSANNYHQLPYGNNYNNDYDVEIIDCKPLNHWLKEIRYLYEPECMTTLQSKSLTADLNSQVTIMAAVTTEAVRTLQFRTKLISTEFSKLYRQVESRVLDHVGPLVQSLVGHVMEFLDTCNTSTSDKKLLIKTCEKLRTVATCSKPDQRLLANETTNLGKAFTECVDSLLLEQVKVLMAVLDEPSSPLLLLTALSSLTGLGLEGQHLSQLVARCSSGIRSILTICLDSRNVSVRTAALRTLATVCCSSHTIRQLEQAGGIEILAEILQDDGRSEMELSEAVSVIVQITAPWIEDNHAVVGLTQQLTPLVSSITRIINNTTSSSTLLLCAAALCHLSQLEPQCVWTMLENSTAGTLLLAIRRQGPFAPVFLREQAAGLLANMAAVPEARSHLAEHRAVVALLCFLQVRHSPLQSTAEVAASERLQHKSAIALSRICTDPAVAAQVVELQGVNRLVRLCREERERNHSDGVLVACLAALRKIVANCGTKSVEELNALELVEPRLLDSFLIYSSRQESYV